jgi:hypothetical protein
MTLMTRTKFAAMLREQALDCRKDADETETRGTSPFYTNLAAFCRGQAAAFESCALLMGALVWEDQITCPGTRSEEGQVASLSPVLTSENKSYNPS